MPSLIINRTDIDFMAKQVNASHILVKSKKKANEILAMLNGGESFEAMAKKYSECPSGKKGGILGWFGRNQMVAEFENAAFKAEAGNVVGPVRTQFGWHLILVNETK